MDNILIDWDLYKLNINKLKEWKIELNNLIETLKDFDYRYIKKIFLNNLLNISKFSNDI